MKKLKFEKILEEILDIEKALKDAEVTYKSGDVVKTDDEIDDYDYTAEEKAARPNDILNLLENMSKFINDKGHDALNSSLSANEFDENLVKLELAFKILCPEWESPISSQNAD